MRRRPQQLDRFIPNRAAMDWGYARAVLEPGWRDNSNTKPTTARSYDYRNLLAEVLGMNKTRVFAFKDKPPTPVDPFNDYYPLPKHYSGVPAKPRREIPKTSERSLDAPDILDDYLLSLLDWGCNNVLSIALGSIVFLWNASNASVSKLVTVDAENAENYENDGPVTSVKWAPDGRSIAVGLNNSDVQLWDFSTNKQLRTFSSGHRSFVGSMDWNNSSILTTGGADGQIINNDVRMKSPLVATYRGHRQEVCGLEWSPSGRQLASGGNDSLLHVWDISMASSSSPRRWLHRMEGHTAAVKALSWCPFQDNLLATGGCGDDRSIKFWNTHTGACMDSVCTGSQVFALLWNKNERELLSSHGFPQNQLILWKYPLMVKIAEITSHTSRVLFMAQSPNGCTVASAAGDEKLQLWNVFGNPQLVKPAPKTNTEPLARWSLR